MVAGEAMTIKVHMVRRSNWFGGQKLSSLCGRVRTMADGMNITDNRHEVTCKFCLKNLAATDTRAAAEAKKTKKPRKATRQLTDLERDNLARVKANKARIKRECNAIGRFSDEGRPVKFGPASFSRREREYAEAHPHLLEQQHCGLALNSERPSRAVELPNGIVIHSTWYKVPTTDLDHTRAYREQQWLLSPEGRATLSPPEQEAA